MGRRLYCFGITASFFISVIF